jgi:4-hydroxy-tetrahydrodipicolinate synthase
MLKGIFTPMMTAFNNDGKIDFKGNEQVINSLIDGGVNGILFLGSTGEFFSMTMEQKKEFISFVIKIVNSRVKVIIGTGGTVVDEVIELTKYAEKEGADAAIVVTPYYYKLDNDCLYEFYSAIAKSIKLPIIIYNFPDRTATNIDPKLVLRLAKDYKNIVGIKDTVDNMSHTRQLIQTVKSEVKDFAVFSGYDEYLIPNLLAGGNGIVGGLSNITPELFVNLYKAYNENNMRNIISLQEKVNYLMKLYEIYPIFMPVVKVALQFMGHNITTKTSSPLGTLSDEQINEIKEILTQAGLI